MTVIFPKGVRNLLRHIFMEFFICAILSMYFIPIILSRSTSNVIPSNLNCVVPHESFDLVFIASVLYLFAHIQITCVLSKLVFNPYMFAKVSSSCNVSSREILVHLEKQ